MSSSQNLDNYTEGYYTRDVPEFWFKKHGLLRPDELAALCYILDVPYWAHNGLPELRDPGLIYSIGCGSGFLEQKLESMGYEVIGVDPSPHPQEAYAGSKLISEYPGGGNTIIFVESIEHIPVEEMERIFNLAPSGTRIVAVNWYDFFPIVADSTGWDHITTIDDAYYDKLCEGCDVILRRGSHLVIDKK